MPPTPTSNPISTHAYDGQNRRITRTDHTGMSDADWDTYYNAAWQALEIRRLQHPLPL